MPANAFQAPIPGQSLTSAPGSFPWERPPEMSDPEEVMQMYMSKLSDPKTINNVLDLLEVGTDIKTLTEGLLRTGVAEGVHSIDVSLIVAPVIHEFIKQSATAAGVDFEEGLEDKAFEKQKQKALTKARIRKEIEKFKKEKPKAAAPAMPEGLDLEGMPAEAIPTDMPTEPPAGFMKRREMV